MHYRFLKPFAFSGKFDTVDGKLCALPRWMHRHEFADLYEVLAWLRQSGAMVLVSEHERSRHVKRLF